MTKIPFDALAAATAKTKPGKQPTKPSLAAAAAKGARKDKPKGPMPWPAAQIELVPIKDLIPYAKNARTHSQSQVLGIARSMEEFGWTNPVLRDEANTIIAGHGRLLAAPILVERGRKEFSQAPVMTARGWSTSQKKAYAIADNQIALNAGWDPKLLESELKDLSGMGFNMDLLGFSPSELRRALGVSGGGLTDPDAVPAVSTKTISRRGDLWMLGKHRILCGDATAKVDVERLFGDLKAPLMVTDPAYGVDYDPSWRLVIRGQIKDVRSLGKVDNDTRSDWREAWALFPGAVAYVWHAGKFAADVQTSLEAAGFEIRSQIVWRKPHFIISRGDYHWQHEAMWYAVRRSHKSNWKGGRKQSTIWDIAGLNPFGGGVRGPENAKTDHSTQKPVECMRRPIENNTDEGETVYDPFLGSGTTIIAAEQVARLCFGLELNPVYVDVAVRRWQNFTGGKALLSGRDISFEEVESERNHGRRKPSKNPGAGNKRAARGNNGDDHNGSTRTKTDADKPARADRKRRPPAAQRQRAEAAGRDATTT